MKNIFLLFLCVALLQACIKDDFIDDFTTAKLVIKNPLVSLKNGDTHQYEFAYFNSVGKNTEMQFNWMSSDTNIASVNTSGLVTTKSNGVAIISVSGITNNGKLVIATDSFLVSNNTVIENIIKSGSIFQPSTYDLTGDFTVEQKGNDLLINFSNNYYTSDQLPGLYIYLTNNPNSPANALEIAAVKTFSGAHSYTVANVGINDYSYLFFYCKPFKVKVGHGEIK